MNLEADNNLDKQRALYDQGYTLISTAINFENQNNAHLALDFYEKGLKELHKAIEIKCYGRDSEECEKMADKIRKTIDLVKERQNELNIKGILFTFLKLKDLFHLFLLENSRNPNLSRLQKMHQRTPT